MCATMDWLWCDSNHWFLPWGEGLAVCLSNCSLKLNQHQINGFSKLNQHQCFKLLVPLIWHWVEIHEELDGVGSQYCLDHRVSWGLVAETWPSLPCRVAVTVSSQMRDGGETPCAPLISMAHDLKNALWV